MIMDQQTKARAAMRWKLYLLLLVLAAVGALGLLPSAPAMFAGVQQSTGMPLPLFMVATFLQSFLLTAVLGFLGLLLSGKTGLGAPVLESLVYRDADDANSAVSPPSPGSKSSPVGVLAFSAVVGLLAGAVVFGVDLLFLRRIEIELIGAASVPGWWQGLLSSLYGGINEEIMMRLFFLNGLLWVLNLVGGKKSASVPWKVWIAVIAASLLFGLGHLPAARAMMVLSSPMVVRILVLNLIPGIVFGVLYWRRGLLSAITAHFSADVLMHAILPLLFPALVGG
jgi:membrane protease YdiL (CAAX protease family)